MTNYLDPLTNPNVALVNDAGADIIQLGLDWVYSMVLFGIQFVIANFATIATLAVLVVVAGFGYKKIMAKGRVKTIT
jgi:hypothetical protein